MSSSSVEAAESSKSDGNEFRTDCVSKIDGEGLTTESLSVASPNIAAITPALISVVEDVNEAVAIVASLLHVSDANENENKELKSKVDKIIRSGESFWSMYRMNHYDMAKERDEMMAARASRASAASSSSSAASPSSSVGPSVAPKPQALAPLRKKNRQSDVEALVDSENVEQERWKVQSELTAIIDESQRRAYVNNERVTAKDVARLTHCGLSGASLWLTVLPIEDGLSLTDREFRSALRHQFGLKPTDGIVYCRCGEPMNAGHVSTCKRVQGPATTDRHNLVATELVNLAWEMCIALPIHVEPQMRAVDPVSGEGITLVPDVLIDFHDGESLAIDVSCVYGESQSYIDKAFSDGRSGVERSTRVVLKQLTDRAKAKALKYTSECKRRGIEFAAFVWETHGHFDASVDRVLEKIAGQAKGGSGKVGPDIGYMKRRLAIAVQKGNAMADRSALFMSYGGRGSAIGRGYLVPFADD
jgi:hypothetical protein